MLQRSLPPSHMKSHTCCPPLSGPESQEMCPSYEDRMPGAFRGAAGSRREAGSLLAGGR